MPEPPVEPLGLSVELLEPPVEPSGLSVELPVEPSGLSVELPVWLVAVGTAVGAVASVELFGWQAARAVDSISTARAAPAFRTARDVDLIRG